MEYIHCDLAMEVAKYLTPKDISTCCSVSLHWREVFGSNEVWKRLCDSEIEEYLRTTPCVVEPTFQLPQHLGTSLPPLSQWRAAFLREQHLWTNWKKRNFKTVEYDLGNNEIYERAEFVRNDLIIRFHSRSVELWDIRADCPVLKDTISFSKDKWYNPIFDDLVFENGIVVLKGGICRKRYKQYSIDILKVNQNESTEITKWHFEYNDKDLSLKPGCSEDKYFSVKDFKIVITPGGKCIGYFPSTGAFCIKNSFSVWDLETGVELRKEFPFLPHNELMIVGCKFGSNRCEDVLVTILHSLAPHDISGSRLATFECKVYNANKLKFLPFKKMFTVIYNKDLDPDYSFEQIFPCVITDGFLALSDCGHEVKEFVRVFNYQTGHELYKLETNEYNTRIQVIRDTFLFTKNKSSLTDYTPGTVNNSIFLQEDWPDRLRLCSFSPSGRVCEYKTRVGGIEHFQVVGRTGLVQVVYSNGSAGIVRIGRFNNFSVYFPQELKHELPLPFSVLVNKKRWSWVNRACTKVIKRTGPPTTFSISYFW
ncbi:uncharacterized protein LOC128986358 isoform X1 [Macrosteles quadrilineatus]|uniref:uncharacterized protein LOC128986358 isoform X1 n=1 Tax=Macrosteles quadrilineatus TaxID=74068 RepID=UPI0023E34B71|nr:uncharacterized protein LOC128986358 isoform X1 [Macrosteles quadrilineatus]